jgi:hypothetical protein
MAKLTESFKSLATIILKNQLVTEIFSVNFVSQTHWHLFISNSTKKNSPFQKSFKYASPIISYGSSSQTAFVDS